MTKQIRTPKKVESKTTKKNTKTGNAKKAPARSSMIVDRSVIADMNSAVVKDLNRIDFDKVVDYTAEEYQRTKGKKEMTEAFILTTPDGVEHFVGQSLAKAFADVAEVQPVGLSLQLIAYKRGNKYLAQ